jgi:hypothetical protein
MTIEDYWAAVKALGLRGRTRGSLELDYLCTTREGQVTQVTDPERLDAEGREAVISLLRQRHGGYDN